MIGKIIKRLFGKEEDTKEISSESNPSQGKTRTGEEKYIDFDLMDDKAFIYYESAYRHQVIVLRRSTEGNRITLGEVLEALFKEETSSVASMAVAYRIADTGEDISETVITNKSEIWNFDLFSCILKRKVDDHYGKGLYHETTLIVNCKSRRYIMTLTSLGGIETIKYMRASVLVPDNQNEDDGRSFQSKNAPVVTSFILTHSEVENNPEYAKYELIEKSAAEKQATNQDPNELELEYFHGKFEFQGLDYIGYGKWLFGQNRYYDTFSILGRAFNYMRLKPLDERDEEFMSTYYDICNIMGQCLSKMDREDEAAYYFRQGTPGVGLDTPNYLALCYAKLGSPTAIGRMQDWLMSVAQKYGDYENWTEEVKQFAVDVPAALIKYKEQADKRFAENPNYDNTITIGQILKALMGLTRNNLAPCMFVYDAKHGKFEKRIEDVEAIIDYVINQPSETDYIFILTSNHAFFRSDEKDDKSILCYHAPLIISTHSIKGDKTNAVMRIDIVQANFANDDNKRDYVRMNAPLTYSICFGIFEELKYGRDNDDLLAAIRKVIGLVDERRIYEAYKLAKWVFECTSDRLKAQPGLEYDSKDELLWGIFFEASYRIGFCLMEMEKPYTSAYYLELASNSGQYLHIQEYVNFLANTKDSQTLSFVEHILEKSSKPNEERAEEWNYHIAFLKRRKAYALIETHRLEEAKAYLTKELLNDPLCKDFAEGELNYIREQERGKE